MVAIVCSAIKHRRSAVLQLCLLSRAGAGKGAEWTVYTVVGLFVLTERANTFLVSCAVTFTSLELIGSPAGFASCSLRFGAILQLDSSVVQAGAALHIFPLSSSSPLTPYSLFFNYPLSKFKRHDLASYFDHLQIPAGAPGTAMAMPFSCTAIPQLCRQDRQGARHGRIDHRRHT